MQQGVSDSEDDDGMPELVPDESDSDVSESVPGFLPDESDLDVSEALPGLDDTCSDQSSYEASTDTKLTSPATDGNHVEVWTMQVPFSLPTANTTPGFVCVLFQHFFPCIPQRCTPDGRLSCNKAQRQLVGSCCTFGPT
jgi:hypothetical protein